MASNYTPEYGLNQWSLEDSVIMEEFNTDNRKIEQALLELKAALPKFQAGSYVGTGKSGADTPTTLTFDFEPKLVILVPAKKVSSTPIPALCIRNAPSAITFCTGVSNSTPTTAILHLTWDSTALQWYASNSGAQYNTEGATYHYWAIG